MAILRADSWHYYSVHRHVCWHLLWLPETERDPELSLHYSHEVAQTKAGSHRYAVLLEGNGIREGFVSGSE